MVTVMIKSDVIQKLDKSKIPNTKNVGANYMGLSYDPNNEYSLPYQWGTTGILYNKKETGQAGRHLGPHVGPAVRGPDRHASRQPGDDRGRARTNWATP